MPPKVPMRTAVKPAPTPVVEEAVVEEVVEQQTIEEAIEESYEQAPMTEEEQQIVVEMSPEIENFEVESFQEGSAAEIQLIAGLLAEVRGCIDGLSVTLEDLENRLSNLIA